jgi:subtilase-type serine protease
MKRIFLAFALSGALGMALLGSASRAMATCAPGTVGAAILGNYAIKIVGAGVDTGVSGDPVPNPIVGIGVIAVDGACDVTGGELIYNDGGTITGPANDAPPRNAVVAFSGSLSANISAGTSYSLNTNNTGFLSLIDTTGGMNGGHPVTFGITVESGGAEFRGVRINGGVAAGSPPPDDAPLTILGERQGSATPGTPALTTATFENPFAIQCDNVGTTSTGLGLGYQPLSGTVQEHPFPPLGTDSIVVNSNLWFNNNGGTINGTTLVSPNGGAFLCDVGGDLVGPTILPSGFGAPSLVDGTQNTDGLFENNFGCPIAANTDSSWVLWGSSYQNAFTIVTGEQLPGKGFTPVTSVESCTAGKTIVGGTDHLAPSPVTLHSTGASATITITNDSASPMDYASITLSSALSGFVTITGGTCTTSAGSIPSDNLMFGPGSCTIILADTGTRCAATGPDHITGSATPGPGLGTLTVALNDHLIAGTTEDINGAEVAVTCTH